MPRQPRDLLRQQLSCSINAAIMAFVCLEKRRLFSGIKANQMQRSPIITRERRREGERKSALKDLSNSCKNFFEVRPSSKN